MSEGKQQIEKEPLWTRYFLLVMATNAFVFLGFQVIMPIMPLYIQTLGVSEGMIGFVTGAFTLTGVIVRPFAGRILDNWGRMPIYIAGLIVCALAIFSYSIAVTVFLLFMFRLVHGIGWGIATTGSSTIASDLIPRSRLGEGMGYYGLTTVIAMAIAPTIGLQLVHYTSYHNIFLLAGAITVVAIFLALPIKVPKIEKKKEKEPIGKLLEKTAYRPAIAIFFITFTYGAVVTFLAIYATELGIANIGPFFTVYAVTLLAVRPLSGALADKRGDSFVVVPGILALIVSILLLAIAKTLPVFLMAGFAYGVGFGATNPALQAMAVRKVPPSRRGAANGTYMNGFDLGIGLGAVIWGLIGSATGFSTMYFLCVIPLVCSLLLFLYMERREKANGAAPS